MIFASLLARLGFDTSAWTSSASKAKADLTGVDKHVKSTLKSIKAEFGKSSIMGSLAKMFMGGGVIAGLTYAGKEIYGLVDKWAGVTKANEQATAAAERYNSLITAIGSANKTAKEWELAANDRLIKSYRDLEIARHPELKKQYEAQGEAQSIIASLEKQRQAIKDLEAERAESIKRVKIAQQDLAPMEEMQGKGVVGWLNKNAGGNYLAGYGDRMKELQKIINDEEAKQIESANKAAILRSQLKKDELTAAKTIENLKTKAVIEGERERKDALAKRLKEESNEREKALKEANRKQAESLVEQRDSLRDSMIKRQGQSMAAVQSDAIRNANMRIVIDSPKVYDPLKTLAERQVSLLKQIELAIKQQKKREETPIEVIG